MLAACGPVVTEDKAKLLIAATACRSSRGAGARRGAGRTCSGEARISGCRQDRLPRYRSQGADRRRGLGLRSPAEVEDAFSSIMASITAGSPPRASMACCTADGERRLETIMGLKRDPQFGMTILFGLGGYSSRRCGRCRAVYPSARSMLGRWSKTSPLSERSSTSMGPPRGDGDAGPAADAPLGSCGRAGRRDRGTRPEPGNPGARSARATVVDALIVRRKRGNDPWRQVPIARASPPASAGAPIRFAGVSKVYGTAGGDTIRALEDVSLSIASGEFVSIVGPSGCGKSTLLKILAGLTPPSTGAVTIADASITAAQSGIGFVFQEATLLPWLTVLRNVLVPADVARIPRALMQSRALGLLDSSASKGFTTSTRTSFPAGCSSARRSAEPCCATPRYC